MRVCRYIFTGLIVILLGVGAEPAQASNAKKIQLSGIADNPTHQVLATVLSAVYEQAGIPMEIRWVPAKRALNEADSGRTDGDIGRIAGTEEIWDNLVQVPTAVMNFKARAYGIQMEPEIRTWSDLKPYRIGIVRGVRFAENATEGMLQVKANSPSQLMRHLINGQVDVAILVDEVALVMLTQDFPDAGVQAISGALYEAPLYHFLHKRHVALIEPLDRALQEMQASGELERLREKALEMLVVSY